MAPYLVVLIILDISLYIYSPISFIIISMQNQGEEEPKKEVQWDDLSKQMKMLVDRNWINKLHFTFHAMFESSTYAVNRCGTKRRKWAHYFKKCTHKETSKDLRKTLKHHMFLQVVLCKGAMHYFRDQYGIENDKLPDAFNNQKNLKEAYHLSEDYNDNHFQLYMSSTIREYWQILQGKFEEETYAEKKVFLGQFPQEERRERAIQKFKQNVAEKRNLAEELKQIQALGEGVTIEKLPVYYDDFDYIQRPNPYMYGISLERLDNYPEIINTMNYIGPEDQEKVKELIKQKRQRQEWIIDYEEQPVVEEEVQQLILQWKEQKVQFMKQLNEFMKPVLEVKKKEYEALLKQIQFQRRSDQHKLSVVRSKQYFEKDPEKKKAYQPEIQKLFKKYKDTVAEQKRLRGLSDDVWQEISTLEHNCSRKINPWSYL